MSSPLITLTFTSTYNPLSSFSATFQKAIQGAQGDSYTFEGAWAAGTYAEFSVVSHNDAIWAALRSTAVEPSAGATADWALIADFSGATDAAAAASASEIAAAASAASAASSAGTATTQAGIAATQAAAALVSRNAADADAIATAADRVQTNADVVATAANLVTVNAAGATQIAAVSAQGTTSIAAVAAQGVTSAATVNAAGTTQVDAVNSAGGTKVAAVAAQGTTSIAAVVAQGATSIAAVDAEAALKLLLLGDTGYVKIYASTADALSNGVTGTTSLVAGSGGTDGTFDIAFSGGAGTNAAGRFTVAGGALVSIVITHPGRGYTSAPTMSFAASSGLTGASATAQIGANRSLGSFFAVATGATNTIYTLYEVTTGPVATSRGDYPNKAALDAVATSLATVAIASTALGLHAYNEDQSDLISLRHHITKNARAATYTSLRAEITGGTGSVVITVWVTGSLVYGPATITAGTVSSVTGLSIAVVNGDDISVQLDTISNVYDIWVELA